MNVTCLVVLSIFRLYCCYMKEIVYIVITLLIATLPYKVKTVAVNELLLKQVRVTGRHGPLLFMCSTL